MNAVNSLFFFCEDYLICVILMCMGMCAHTRQLLLVVILKYNLNDVMFLTVSFKILLVVALEWIQCAGSVIINRMAK